MYLLLIRYGFDGEKMLINLVFFKKETGLRVAKKSILYFKDNESIRIFDNAIRIGNMYIHFDELNGKLATINVFNQSSDYKTRLNDFIHYILNGEEVYIATNTARMYFENFTDETNIENILLSLKEKEEKSKNK